MLIVIYWAIKDFKFEKFITDYIFKLITGLNKNKIIKTPV